MRVDLQLGQSASHGFAEPGDVLRSPT